MEVKLISGPSPESVLRNVYAIYKSSWTANYDLDYREATQLLIDALKGAKWCGVAFESINFVFSIEEVSRTFTHQFVRVRVGAGFGQQSMRDNDVSSNKCIIPKTFDKYCANSPYMEAVKTHFEASKTLYKELVEKGVPLQDARFVLPEAISTNIVITINYQALLNLAGARLCNSVQWEINECLRLMRRRIQEYYNNTGLECIGDFLRSRCEYAGKCIMKTDVFPPCGKFMTTWNKIYKNSIEKNTNMSFVDEDRIEYKEWRKKYFDK